MKRDLFVAIQNLEEVIGKLVNNPPKDVDINALVRDYNTIRNEVNKALLEK